MKRVEYELSADGDENVVIRFAFLTSRKGHDEAVQIAAKEVCSNPSYPEWTLNLVERNEEPEKHNAKDAMGSFHLIEVARFDRAIGIIYKDL